MTLLVLLVAIGIQHYLHLLSAPYRIDWMGHYYNWMVLKIEYVTKGHGLLGLAILLVPILLAVSLVLAVTGHLFNKLGYYIVCIIIFWYSTDARDYRKSDEDDSSYPNILVHSYQFLFSRIFWFGISGPVGLTFYYVIFYFRDHLLNRQDTESQELEFYSQKLLSVCDWIPVRLFTLCFALVGHFPVVFSEWTASLFEGLDSKLTMITHCSQSIVKTRAEAASLLNRVLVVWLVAIGLLTIGVFFH